MEQKRKQTKKKTGTRKPNMLETVCWWPIKCRHRSSCGNTKKSFGPLQPPSHIFPYICQKHIAEHSQPTNHIYIYAESIPPRMNLAMQKIPIFPGHLYTSASPLLSGTGGLSHLIRHTHPLAGEVCASVALPTLFW